MISSSVARQRNVIQLGLEPCMHGLSHCLPLSRAISVQCRPHYLPLSTSSLPSCLSLSLPPSSLLSRSFSSCMYPPPASSCLESTAADSDTFHPNKGCDGARRRAQWSVALTAHFHHSSQSDLSLPLPLSLPLALSPSPSLSLPLSLSTPVAFLRAAT